jgi:voltage-gated potassium channel
MRLIVYNRKEDGSFLSYIFSFAMLIDLLALIPFYLTLVPVDLRYLRIFRLFRFARIFKLSRYNKAIHSISIVIKNKKELLTIVFVLILFVLYIVSALMYFVENPAQPEAFSSILSTMWWGVATLTTVGYGDIYPITGLGKILGGIIAILGIGLFAIPTGIIASGFLEYFKENKWKE